MENRKPFFSVIIPSYNRADLILNTLQTVFNQTYKNYEIIVVDNCSTDNTQDVLKPFISNNKIKYIRHEKNMERSHARNTGIENARGDYLTLLDSDDFMYEDCLADAAEFATKYPAIKVFQNKFELVDSNRNSIYLFPFPNLDNQYKALCSGNFMSCIGGFIHKSVYNIHKFDTNPDLIGSEDYEYWFRVFTDNKIGRIEKVNSGVLQHVGRSINNNIYGKLEYQLNYIIDKIQSTPKMNLLFGPHINMLKSTFHFKLAMISLEGKQYSKAFNYFFKVIQQTPGVVFSRKVLSFGKSLITT